MKVHRKRDKKIWKKNNVKDEEQRKYFKELLDGTEVDVNKILNIGQLKLEKEEVDINKEENEEGLKEG